MPKKTSGSSGKKAAGTAIASAGATNDLKKVYGDWQWSSVTERQLDLLRRDGHLPSTEKMKTRAPEDEVIPRPKDEERVCFVDFVNRVFAFPIHEFLRGLMYAYGLMFAYGVQLTNLLPTPFCTSCDSLFCASVSSAYTHTGAYGSGSSM